MTSHISVFASIHDVTKAIAREILQRTSDLETRDLAHHNSWLSKEGREFELWEHDGTSLTGRIATPGSRRVWVSGHLDRCAEEFWDTACWYGKGMQARGSDVRRMADLKTDDEDDKYI